MRIGKLKMFLLLNGVTAFFFVLYFIPWLSSDVTTAKIVTPYEATKVHVSYTVNGVAYFGDHLRNGIEFSTHSVPLRYLRFHPQSSRINSFMGMWAEPLAWWSVFLMASAMLLLTHNTVFSKGTIFQFQNKFPWISMEEFFPFNSTKYGNHSAYETEINTSNQKKKNHLLKKGAK